MDLGVTVQAGQQPNQEPTQGPVIERLSMLGFNNAAVARVDSNGYSVCKIRTSKGWVWERFDPQNLSAVSSWAIKHKPEVTDAD